MPCWKTEIVTIPGQTVIVRDDLYTPAGFPGTDEPYFRMIHHLDRIPDCRLPAGFIFIRPGAEELARHIAVCYQRECASAAEILGYMEHPVYDPNLWIAVVDTRNQRIVASGIAEFDRRVREGILEWIQVSPEYRHRGLGRLVVCELLRRLAGKASFVTVSGRLRNPDNPLALYESCGFTGTVIWHVITAETKAEDPA